MLIHPLVKKGAATIPAIVGDMYNSIYYSPVGQTAGGAATQAITALLLARGDVFVNATTAAQNCTLPTADEICNAIRGNLNRLAPPNDQAYVTQNAVVTDWPAQLSPLPTPSSFRRRIYSRNASGANTLVAQASSGINITDLAGVAGGAVAMATNTWRDLEFLIHNSTPTVIAAGATVAAGFTLTLANPALARNITPGMSAYLSSDTGWDVAGTKVTKVDIENGVITMLDAAANTAPLVAVTLTPTIQVVNVGDGVIVAAHLT